MPTERGEDLTDSGWISLSFDDALEQHRKLVIPLMSAHGLPGTFYVHLSALDLIHHLDEWRAAAEVGHELGNHTVFHPAVSAKAWVRPGNAIDHYSLDRMRMELEFANAWLSAVDGRTERTFAYPCSNAFIGHHGWVLQSLERLQLHRTRLTGWVNRFHLDLGSTRQSYADVVGDLFIAGRGGGLQRGATIPPVHTWSRTRLLSVAVDDWTLLDLQQAVNAAISHQTWVILQFHGVGGGHRMNCAADVFAEFVGWLQSEHSERVLTVIEGARRLWPDREHRSPGRPTVETTP